MCVKRPEVKLIHKFYKTQKLKTKQNRLVYNKKHQGINLNYEELEGMQ